MPALLSPPEAVALLESAQCAEPADAASILATLPPRLSRPHPSTTSAALDLLQIHPTQTLPHIPDLISAHDVSALLETLSTLLSSDRTLLTPILGVLPALPLTPQQRLHTRATLSYALAVVDDDDVPVVVRTLASVGTSWAARVLRDGLSRPLSPAVTPVVSHALRDALRARTPLGHRLLAIAAPPLAWPDLLVYALALSHVRLRSDAARALSRAVRGGLLARCEYARAVARAAPALAALPGGVARMLAVCVAHARREAAEVAALARFCVHVLTACPAAAAFVVGVRGVVGAEILRALVGRVRHPALQAGGGLHRVPRVAVRVLRDAAEGGHEAWNALFIAVRKAALFGLAADRERVMALARCLVEDASPRVVLELMGVLDASVPASLADGLAVGLLEVAGACVMRGIAMSNLFERRVEQQVPQGLLRKVQERDYERVQVDVGLIWRQSPTAIATVVPTAVALTLAQGNADSENIAAGLLSVAVLVPVVCISLYQAVEDLVDTTTPAKRPARRTRKRLDVLPTKLLELDSDDLTSAILSFAAGMASLVGLLNVSCRQLGVCFRVVQSRRQDRRQSRTNRNVLWALLDRLTEFDRMLNAMELGFAVLQRQAEEEKKTRSSRASETTSRRQRKQAGFREALTRAEKVLSAVMTALYSFDGGGRRRSDAEENPDFPRFSVESVVASLVAVPDEEGIETIGDEKAWKQTRDLELVRIDKLLLRHLLRLMTGASRGGGTDTWDVDHTNGLLPSKQLKASEWEREEPEERHELSKLSIDELFPDLDKQLEDKDDIFFDEGDIESEDESAKKGQESSTVMWASNRLAYNENSTAYMRASVTLFLRDLQRHKPGEPLRAVEIIHSPAFAALLLDRASTHVAVARRARLSSEAEGFLSDAAIVSGLALGCLVQVLRSVPMIPFTPDTGAQEEVLNGASEEERTCRFLNELGSHLLVGVPPDDRNVDKSTVASKHLSEDGWKVLETLRWIAATSIEAVVASSAVECVLTVSEFLACRKSYARQLSFTILTTVYEYEGAALWDEGDLALMTQDSYGEWSLRRRRSQELQSDAHDGPLGAPDLGPWIDLTPKSATQRRSVERQRLVLFFSGMHIPNALLEGCGWIREIASALKTDKQAPQRAKRKQTSQARLSHIHPPSQENSSPTRHDIHNSLPRVKRTCDILLEMTGFRTIVETLLQLVLLGLRGYPISDEMFFDNTPDGGKNPVHHVRTSLLLFGGVLGLYHDNRQKLISTLAQTTSRELSIDADLDATIITTCIGALQMIRSRVDGLLAWYSNPSTDVSELSSEFDKDMHDLIGASAQAVSQCAGVAESIKNDQALTFEDGAAVSQGEGVRRTRKAPGYVKQKRKAGSVPKPEEMSKARRLIPRLTSQSENTVKSLQKLGKAIGIRSRQSLSSLAPLPAALDGSLHFGVGLRGNANDSTTGGDKMSIEEPEEEGQASAHEEADTASAGHPTRKGTDFGKDGTDAGFRARASKEDRRTGLEQQTVTVNFKR